MKKMIFQLKPNKDKKFKVELLKDDELVRTEYLSGEKFKQYMNENIEPEVLAGLKDAIKKFKLTEMTIVLKENK